MDIEPAAWADEQLSARVDKVLQRRCPPTAERKSYTPEQAAEAIIWKLEDLVHQVATQNGLDRSDVHRQVYRRFTLNSLRLRDRPNDLPNDVLDMANEFKKSQFSGG